MTPFSLEQMEEAFNGSVFYRELGYYLIRKEDYERSLKFFDQSIKRDPANEKAIEGRATARANANRFIEAVNDINVLLKINPDNIYYRSDNANIIYSGCEFEEALIENYRNLPLRKKPENFIEGILLCEGAIRNSIDIRAGHPLRDHFKIVRRMAWLKTLKEQRPVVPVAKNRIKKKKTVFKSLPSTDDKEKKKRDRRKKVLVAGSVESKPPSGPQSQSTIKNDKIFSASLAAISEEESIKDSLQSHSSSLDNLLLPAGPPIPYKPPQKYTSNLENYLAEKYLGRLCYDKSFLRKLMCQGGTSTANEKGSKRILKMIMQSYDSICHTQEILRSRRPFYYIKHHEELSCGKLEERMRGTFLIQQKIAMKQANKLLMKVEESARKKRLRSLLEDIENLAIFCENTSKNIFPTRKEYILKMCRAYSDGIHEIIKYPYDMTEEQRRTRARTILGLPPIKSKIRDYIAQELQCYYVNLKTRNNTYEKRLYKAESSEELAWIYHELARVAYKLKNYDSSRLYAKKCISEANHSKNLKWILSSMLVLVKIEVSQRDKNSAESQLKRARKMAILLKDDEMLSLLDLGVTMIQQAALYEEMNTILEARQEQIISFLNTSTLKVDAQCFFRRMNQLPASMRMSVVPGLTYTDPDDKESIADGGSQKVEVKPAAFTKSTRRGITFLDI